MLLLLWCMSRGLPCVSVMLVRPEHPGNVGAVARVMANFSFSRLILVDPRCDYLCDEARNRAKHAQHVLEGAVVVESIGAAGCDWLVATSGKLGSDYNLPRSPLSPRELAGKVSRVRGRSVCLVFGPESSGLTNDEIRLCDVFVSIPAHREYPVLNLSHSVAIVLYELFVARHDHKSVFTPLSSKEKEVLFHRFEEVLSLLPFESDEKRMTQRVVWRRLIGKSFLTRRESFALLGFFRKVLFLLKK